MKIFLLGVNEKWERMTLEKIIFNRFGKIIFGRFFKLTLDSKSLTNERLENLTEQERPKILHFTSPSTHLKMQLVFCCNN